MKKLMPDLIKKPKNLSYGIEHFKGKSNTFWDGMLIGIILGYMPYLWHMHF